jgi:hypothetical protein
LCRGTNYQKAPGATLVAALSFVVVSVEVSIANPTTAELQAAIASLEARVEALESKLQRYEPTNEASEETQPKPILASLAEPIAPGPMQLGASTKHVAEQGAEGGGLLKCWRSFF